MPPPMPLLRHIHLRNPIPYPLAQLIQAHLVSQHLTYKALLSSRLPPPNPPPAPLPTVLTFQSKPVYTLGRRESLSSLPASTTSLLQTPLTDRNTLVSETAEIIPTHRGGQTTFHGPGQVTIYPILSLSPPFPLHPRGLKNIRAYVCALEGATIATLSAYGVRGIRTENPGVWTADGERKIAALGVQMRRWVSSYGVGLNVGTDLRWFERIVACGLVGKGVTSLEAEGGRGVEERGGLDGVAGEWVRRFYEGLWGNEEEGAVGGGLVRRGWEDLELPVEVGREVAETQVLRASLGEDSTR